ncbi:hypothetical protein SCALM49S_09673 [Streptomyces californicus]
MAAATNGPSNITVNPYSVHQGATMKVTAQGCGHGGKVWSNAFPTTELSAGGTGYATAHIRHNTTPGHYNLSVKCNDNSRIETGLNVLVPPPGEAKAADGATSVSAPAPSRASGATRIARMVDPPGSPGAAAERIST